MIQNSDKPLIKKLGFSLGESVCAIGEPQWYGNFLLENGVANSKTLPADWAHVFITSIDELQDIISNLVLDEISRGLWVSWPKRSSGVAGDVSENDLRDTILPLGWVDIKVCAIDDIWSGLKFTRRAN